MESIKKTINSEFFILNAIQGAAAILDERGDIVTFNMQWRLADIPWFSTKPKGGNYLDYCKASAKTGNDFALRILLGIREILEGSRDSFNMTVTDANTENKWSKVEVSRLDQSLKNHLLLVFNDITENMKPIQTLRESEAKYRQYFKYSTAAIILAKPGGEILDVNPAACKVLGYSKAELLTGGLPLIIDVHYAPFIEAKRIKNNNSVFAGEVEFKHKSGDLIPVQLSSAIYQCGDGSKQIINTFQNYQ